ncbi:MAG TPA: phosphoadenylyl-sulfate reductase [Bryobacteraceae bacterium]|jgi:phosphoadenosine phosphosulfate reductase|nr:phosphoadenylyl-sulfate reductase [Bryobacteraceae bacterium]
MSATLETEARESIAAHLPPDAAACFTCSFQAEDMVVLHLLRERRPSIPVLFLETGYHFAEVYRYRNEMVARYNLNLVNVTPAQTVAQQEAQFGILYQSQPDQCCKLRKVGPLFAALENYDVWFTGLRRVQSPTRANLALADRFPLPSGKQLWKISPLASWSDKDVWTFAREHGIPLLPLYDAGYTSIGCQPCTALPADPGNARSGRWAGRKLECGIHIAEATEIPVAR